MHWLEYNGCPATGLDSGSENHLPTALHKVRPATHSKAAAPEGVCIAHGGAPAFGAQQHQRPGACAQGRPPSPPGALPLQRRHPQTGAAGDSELGADGRVAALKFLDLQVHRSG